MYSAEIKQNKNEELTMEKQEKKNTKNILFLHCEVLTMKFNVRGNIGVHQSMATLFSIRDSKLKYNSLQYKKKK